jgi:PAS domain-containing protein
MTYIARLHSSDLRFDPDFFHLIAGSYARIVGRPLVEPGRNAAWLYHHVPFAVVAHNVEADPRFIYANRAAQACFEYSWEEFTALPSRFSAEAPERAERQELLDAVGRNGFASGYRGIRVAKSGRRFRIEDGVVWQLIDANGVGRGQAATFSSWSDL